MRRISSGKRMLFRFSYSEVRKITTDIKKSLTQLFFCF